MDFTLVSLVFSGLNKKYDFCSFLTFIFSYRYLKILLFFMWKMYILFTEYVYIMYIKMYILFTKPTEDFYIISILFGEKVKRYRGKLTIISDSFLGGRRAGRGGRVVKVQS